MELKFFIVGIINEDATSMEFMLCNANKRRNNEGSAETVFNGSQFWEYVDNLMTPEMESLNLPVIIQRFEKHGPVFLLKGLDSDTSVGMKIQRRSSQEDPSFVYLMKNYTKFGKKVGIRCLDVESFISKKLQKLIPNLECKLEKLDHLITWLENLRSILHKAYKRDIFANNTLTMFSLHRMQGCLSEDNRKRFMGFNGEFTEKPRPGVGSCNKRIAKANNKYLKDFNESIPAKYIVHVDANNLAGWAMSQKLPIGGCHEIPEVDFQLYDSKEKIERMSEKEKDFGYVFKLDLKYPKELYESHDDYPFCPEYKKCQGDDEKSIACLGDKKNYVIHYKLLLLALENGLVIDKVHTIWKFQHDDWLRRYIEKNTKLRNNTDDKFEKNLFKMLNNVLAGKFWSHKCVRSPLVTTWDRAKEHFNDKSKKYVDRRILDENLCLLEFLHVTDHKYNLVGFTIEDLIKFKMYDFHYNCMKRKYPQGLTLLYTQTDSFIYEIETDDYYNDLAKDNKMRSYFDTTSLQSNHNVPEENFKILGKMKDELEGNIAEEFLSTGLKYYYFGMANCESVSKIAGTDTEFDKKDFEHCIHKRVTKPIMKNFFNISENFEIVRKNRKLEILSYDNNRDLISDIKTKAFRN